jgi:hypothetical protein
MAGLSLYFGGEDKSLIRRHREDDPSLHFFNIFSAGLLGGGGGVLGGEPEEPTCDYDSETQLPDCGT